MAQTFLDVLAQHRVPTATHTQSKHVRPGWLGLECPLCGKGTGKFGLGYSLSTGRLNCWKCGPHKLSEVLEPLLGITTKQARRLSMSLIQPRRLPKDEIPEHVGGRYLPPAAVKPMTQPHKDYLIRRGFDPEEIAEVWGVKGIGVAARLAWRLFIPIFLAGEPVSWTTRSIGEQGLRYVSACRGEEKIHHKDILYGEDKCAHAIVVNEGPLDAWAVGPGGVATCGVGWTAAQLERMSNYPVRVVCFDNEFKAQQRARKLCDELEVFPGITHNVTLSGKDASRSPKSEIQELRKRFLE